MRTDAVIVTFDPGFTGLALQELPPVGDGGHVSRLDDGVLLVTGLDFFDVAARWQSDPPIFIRHCCPAMLDAHLQGDGRDVELLAGQATVLADLLDPGLTFSVQTRILSRVGYKPFDVNNAVADVLAAYTGAQLNVRNPDQIVSVVVTDAPEPTPTGEVVGYLGVSLAVQNLSNWAGGTRRFAREPEQISRAEFKLLEALEVFGVELPPRGVALDLGAAPGGWTRVLRGHDQYVTAVDPGALDARLEEDSRVRHIPTTAEAYLRSEPDRFDVIVNDMRMDARDSAWLMVAYAPQLYADGQAIMTLKLPETGREPIIEEAFAILNTAYVIAGARQLFHNRSEITLLLRKV